MESKSSILKHRGKSYLLQELQHPKLNEIEKLIIEARINGLSFCQIDDTSIKCGVDDLFIKTAAVTGCSLPQTEFFAAAITDELTVFLNDFGYGDLTFEEMYLAIRMNTKVGLKYPSGVDVDQVEFSGNTFNLQWFSKILSNYMVFRGIVDSKFRNKIDGYEL